MPPRPERIGERLRGERDGEYARAFPRLDVGGGGDGLRGVVHRGDGVLRRLRRARGVRGSGRQEKRLRGEM